MPPRRSRRPIIIGFGCGVGLWLLPVITSNLSRSGYGREIDPFMLLTLIFASLVLPPVSGVLALIPKTRRFGLGLLLASGLGWLVLGSLCGGIWK